MAKWFNLESAFPFSCLPLENTHRNTHTATHMTFARVRGCCVHIVCTYICIFTILNVKINAKASPCPYLPLTFLLELHRHIFYTLSCGPNWVGKVSSEKLIRFSYISQFCITKLQIHQRNNNKSRTCCLTRTKAVALTPSLLCVNAVQRERCLTHTYTDFPTQHTLIFN